MYIKRTKKQFQKVPSVLEVSCKSNGTCGHESMLEASLKFGQFFLLLFLPSNLELQLERTPVNGK